MSEKIMEELNKTLTESVQQLQRETEFHSKYAFLVIQDNLNWIDILIQISKDTCGLSELMALKTFISLRKRALTKENLPMNFNCSSQGDYKEQKVTTKQKDLAILQEIEKLLEKFINENDSFSLKSFSDFLRSRHSIFRIFDKEDKISLSISFALLLIVWLDVHFSILKYEELRISLFFGTIPFPYVFDNFITPIRLIVCIFAGYLTILTTIKVVKKIRM